MSIEIKNLNFSYSVRQVLSDVSLSIKPEETLTVLGPNGCGKTTLLNIITGLLAPPPGSISYNGKPFRRYEPREMARLVGYVPQTIVPAFDYSVIDYVVTGCAPQIGTFQRPKKKHYDIAMEAIGEMGISHLAEKSYKQISGGERQQVSIARVLAQSPTYIIMDEPTAHLDYGNQVRVLNTIKRLEASGYGVVFSTHNPDQALLVGGKAAIIDKDGKLTYGDCHELINEDVLSQLYSVRLRITDTDEPGRKVCFAPGLGNVD